MNLRTNLVQYSTAHLSMLTGVANPTTGRANLRVKGKTSRESRFARALTVRCHIRHPSRRSEALYQSLQGIWLEK